MRYIILPTILMILLVIIACAQDVPVTPIKQDKPKKQEATSQTVQEIKLPPDRNKSAIIIVGISGEELYAERFSTWKTRLYSALVEKLGFADDRITVLTERPEGNEKRATAENVKQTFATLKDTTGTDDRVFIFFIGHCGFDGKIARFNLAGPDLTANDYGQLIGSVPTKDLIVVVMSSASGEFVKPLSAKGRIIITATRSGMEQNAPKFAEHFIASLGNPEADTDKNGRVSALESFNYATKLTNDSYKQAGTIATEHALLDDNGDGVGHQTAEAGDGVLAKTTYFDSLPLQQAGGDAELAKLFTDRMRLEGEVEQLKARKDEMKSEEYEAELEKLLIELAKIGQRIRAKGR